MNPVDSSDLDDPITLVEPVEAPTMPPPVSLESLDRKLDQLMQAVTRIGNDQVQARQHMTEAIDALGARVRAIETHPPGNGASP